MAQLIKIKSGSSGAAPGSLLTGEPAYSINDNKLYIGNGSSVVRVDAGSYTAECTTAAATPAKVATCPGIILIKGVEVTVKFTEDNTVAPASLRLNINNTGAWPILYRGSSLPSASVLSANRVYKFYYNGTSWELIGDLDTTVGAALSSHTGNSTIHITGAERANWDTAYGWGNHAGVGYLTAITKSQVEAVLTGSITSHTHSYALLAGSTTQNFSAKNLTLAGTITGASTIEAHSYILNRASYTIPNNSPGWYRIATYTPAGGEQAMNGVLLVNTKYHAAYPEAYKVLVSGIYNTPRVTILESNVNGAKNWVTKFRVTTYQVGAYTWSYAVDVYWSLDSAAPQTLQVASIGTLTSQTPVLYTTFDTDGHSQYVEIDIIPNVSSFVGGISATSITASSTIQATTAKLTNLSNGYLPYHISDASGLANSPIYTDGVNVGIGTTVPNTRLTVGVPYVQDVLDPIVTGQVATVTLGGLYGVRDGAGDQYGLALKTYKLNVGLTEAVRINNQGNVGIGTTSPGAKLHIFGDTVSQVIARFGEHSSTGRWDIVNAGNPTDRRALQGYYGTTKTIEFNPNGASYFNSGNVGIGTTDPLGYKLYVSGTGHYTSNLSVGGTLGVTGNTTLSGTLGVTGASTLSTATITNQLKFGSSGKWINYYGSASLHDVTAFNLSIKHPTPFIDFYFNGAGSATSRIIEQATGVLDVIGSVKIPDSKYLQIGSARLTYETVGGVGFLKLAHSNGTTPMHLVTTGGQTMYSTGVPATGGGGGATILLNNVTYGEGSTANIYSPPGPGTPGYILKADDPSGFPVWGSITNLLPDASTSVKGVVKLSGTGSTLGYATTVARSDHNHSGVYAAYSHTHSGYAELSHNHTTLTSFQGITYVDSNSEQQNMLIRTGTGNNDILLGNADHNLTIRGDNVKIETDVSPRAGFWKSDGSGNLSVDTNTYALSSHNHTGVYAPITHSHNYLSSVAANMTDVRIGNVNGLGIRFWDQDEYKIFMSQATDVSYGGRILGETTSDYNMYFRFGTHGVNRGFVFESSYGVKLAAINPDAFRTVLPLIVRSTETSYDNSRFTLGNATLKFLAASDNIEINKGLRFTAGTIQGAVIDNYGVCSTAVGTAAKAVTISGFRLATGVQINVKFSNDNYSYPITLNVSNTGAKTVKAYGDSSEQDFIEQIKAGAVIPFVYDGTYWVIPTTPSMY